MKANQPTRRNFLQTLGSGALGAAFMMGSTPPPWPPIVTDGDEDTFWRLVRSQYPLTDARAYLNTGGLGPVPYPVLDALQRTLLELVTVSETGHDRIEASREPVASFLGAKSTEISFTRNATEGNAIIAAGLDLKKDDEVIFESHAHPGGSLPWLNRQKLDGIRVKLFEPDPENIENNVQRIADQVTPRTRVIQVSHVTAPTGIHFPVEAITRLAHDRGLWFHIDGAQSVGMIPVDLKAIGCDSFATSGHKWMGGPHGTGIIYVREERLDEVKPVEVGAYSDSDYRLPDLFEYHPTARRYEYGTRDASQITGLVAAVRFLEQLGMHRVRDYGHTLARYLQDELRKIEGVTVLTPELPALASSMTTFRIADMTHTDLFGFLLEKYKLRCRPVSERDLNAVRVSTHVFNSKEECDRVIEGTRAALKTR